MSIQPKQLKRREGVTYQKPQPMNFVKLKPGQAYEGIFLGIESSKHGAAYSFADPDTGERFEIGGGRVELDRIFSQVMGNPTDFPDQTLIGHRLEVGRLEEDTIAKESGNHIAQYVLAHIKQGCPKGCVSKGKQAPKK